MAEKKKAAQAANDTSVEDLTNALYASCATKPEGTLWFQEDFLKLNVIPDRSLEKLNECVSGLSSSGLLKLHLQDGKPCWKVVAREDAEKYRGLTTEEAIVYSHVQSAGTEGAWNKLIRTRSNLHETVCKRVLKSLEGKGLIKRFKSAKQPSARFYIDSDLQPSEDATGGAFYQDGKLDEEFVQLIAMVAQHFIHKRSWRRPSAKDGTTRQRSGKLVHDENEVVRSEGLDSELKARGKLLPRPPGYRGYPNLSEITAHVNASPAFQVKLKEAEVKQILEVLCWEGRIEKVLNGIAYRTTLSAPSGNMHEASEVAGEVPCVHCPVFDFCDESGPVNAQTCPYFQDWLAI